MMTEEKMTEYTYTPAQEKALERGKSICVTAGAGTGKTFLLTQKFLSLLESGVLPRDIVALTYTDKAAAEMQTKISRELKKQAETRPELRESWETFSQGTISTFHGFCLSILKEFAYEAGVDPGFSVMDELDKTELVERTITDVLEHPPEELFDTVVRIFAYTSPGDIKQIIRSLASADAEWFSVLQNDPESIRLAWISAYREYMGKNNVDTSHPFFALLETADEAEYLLYLKDWFFTDPVNCGLIERLNAADSRLRNAWRGKYLYFVQVLSAAQTPQEIYSVCVHSPDLTVKSKKDFPVFSNEPETVSSFLQIFKSLSFLPGKESRVFTLTRSLLLDFYRTAKYCAEKIAGEKRRAGVLDFDDLIELTDRLLSAEHPEILQTVSQRCRYVLVDEVQDNDPKLIRLVKKLCGDPKESDRLFIVGDAKQSIYLFRNADVAGFMGLQAEFPEKPVALDTSFRSTPEIICFVNELFSGVFQNQNKPWDPPYDAIHASRKDACGSVSCIQLPYDRDKSAQKIREAEALASWIYDAVALQKRSVYQADGTLRPARFSDVAILIERRTRLPYLRPALEKYGIAYEEASGKDFYAKQETADLRNVLSAVLYPEEDVSLYGALRSPYFSVSDAELESAAHKESGTLSYRLNKYAKANPESRIAAALQDLRRWREYARHLSPSAALQRILQESEIFSLYSSVSGGTQMEGNLIKLQDILRSRSSAKPFSLQEFVALLDVSMEGDLQEGDGEPADDSGDRVKIMTVHSSKGLEYPIVCCAYAGYFRASPATPLVFHEKLGYGISVRPYDGDSVNILRTLIKNETEDKEGAERKRLFYVAATRARDHLVLCGSEETKAGYSEKSFMKMYQDAKSGLSQNPFVYSGALCDPDVSISPASYTAGDAVSHPIPAEDDEPAVISRDAEYAMQRGTLLHSVFAGESSHADFADMYAEFLSCPLMENVVFERCEMPVVCGGERRVIDRFVRYADGTYAVIDYKTGSIASAKSSGRFAEYENQVRTYMELMQEIVGSAVSGWLYFADENPDARIIRIQ